MNEERLFDYEEVKPRRRRSSPPDPTFVIRTPDHSLLINRFGVSGFHLVRMTNEYGSTLAECGFMGRILDDGDAVTVPECAKCVLALAVRSTTAKEKQAKRKQ